MSLKIEILPFIDGNGLVAPNIVPPGVKRASDNGPLFLSEYIIALNRNNEINHFDLATYFDVILRCKGIDGSLHRAPGDSSPDEIDDNLGVLAAFAEFNVKTCFTLPFDLWRFPQLVFAYLLNKGIPSLLLPPLNVITALVIATSCIGADPSDSTSRILNWLLWQACKRKSILCHLAGKFWHWRQKKVYNTETPMKAISRIFFPEPHPLPNYFID